MNVFGRNILVWIALVLLMVGVYNLIQGTLVDGGESTMAFTDFLDKVTDDKVSAVIMQGPIIEGKLADGTRFSTYATFYPGLVDLLMQHHVRLEVAPTETRMGSLIGVLLSWFPVLLLIGVWIFFMRQMQGGGGRAMGFGKSKARLTGDRLTRVTFEDVAGIDEAKEELSEIVEFLRAPSKFQKLGGKIPKGCLLIGPPGTGKTLLARAIAGEAKVPFYTISGSDFVELFVGVGASRVRDMFEQGKRSAPCIIFIDEIDAVGRNRGIGLGGGNDEREQTLNQLLVEMDGFESNEGVIIIAATNRPDVLDPALLRPGRFDRQIVVAPPDIHGREQILQVHLRKIVLGPDVEARVIARGTPGFSGADLANLVNEAALLAARVGRRVVTMAELEAAKDKVMMGPERRSMIMRDEEKRLTAYHEGGHAVVAMHMPHSDPIHKATIIPRGRALGLVIRLPETDKFSETRAGLKAIVAIAMGGRVAEELIFGYDKVTSGAAQDLQQATRLARAMVSEWGMSDKVGPLYYGKEQSDAYNIHGTGAVFSQDTANTIDTEIKLIVEEGYAEAKRLLQTHIDQLHKLASALLEYETLTGAQIRALLLENRPIEEIMEEAHASHHEAIKRSSVPSTSEDNDDAAGQVPPASSAQGPIASGVLP